MEKRVLGRGLGALIPEKTNATTESMQGVSKVQIDKIRVNKFQPRQDFDKTTLEDLASSIKEKGIIQPIIVRECEEGYELIAGERRFRAVKMLGIREIPAIVKNVSDVDSLELSIIENVQREGLNPIDQAKAYQRLLDEFGMTQEDIADTIGKDRSTITNILRLLKLPEKIRGYVSRGTISMGHARALLALHNNAEQLRLCTKIIQQDLSVRDTEKHAKKASSLPKQDNKAKDPNLTSIEEELRDRFGTKVKISKGKRGGKIEIEFYSDNDLDRVINLLKSNS